MKIKILVIAVALVITGIALSTCFAQELTTQKAMTIELKAGKKVITHPSGVISEYTQADIERQIAEMTAQRDALNEQIKATEKELGDAKATIGKE